MNSIIDEIIKFYKKKGNKTIPANQFFYANDTFSEALQKELIDSKFLNKKQLIGTNEDWIELIEKLYLKDKFNPAIVYLNLNKYRSLETVMKFISSTIFWCGHKSLLAIETKLDVKEVINDISRQVPGGILKKFDKKIENFSYENKNKTYNVILLYKNSK